MCYITHSLRFTSGVTPANLLAASMAAEPSPHTCKAMVGLETRSYHAAAQPKLLDCVKENSKDNEDLLLTLLEVQ